MHIGTLISYCVKGKDGFVHSRSERYFALRHLRVLLHSEVVPGRPITFQAPGEDRWRVLEEALPEEHCFLLEFFATVSDEGKEQLTCVFPAESLWGSGQLLSQHS